MPGQSRVTSREAVLNKPGTSLIRRLCAARVASALLVIMCAWGQVLPAQNVRRPTRRALPSNPPQSTPEAQGMNSTTLAAGIEFLMENRDTYRVHSVVVIRNDRIVLDARFYPFSRGWTHDIASVTKSFTSTLIGIAIDKGFISGLDVPMLDFFPDHTIANRDARKERMTLDDLITMRSGFECDPNNSEATLTELTNSPDWVQFALDLPMADEPGTRHVYCSPNVHLLSAILERSTGMSTLGFARKYLFGPLGMTSAEWFTDPQGIQRGWGDLHLEPSEMPRLGLLFLNGGRWRGRQIVPPEWVEESTVGASHAVPGWPPDQGYAYLWYSSPDQYFAAGRGGQRIHVYPDEDLVVGLNAGSGIGDYGAIPTGFLETYVLGAIESDGPLTANPNGVDELATVVTEAAASNEGPAQAVPPLPAIAQAISGQLYELSANIHGLSSMRFTCPGGDVATLDIALPELAGGPLISLEIGLDNVNRFSPGRHGVMTASKGGWVSDNRFTATMDELGWINLWRWDLEFTGDTVNLTLESLAGGELPATAVGSIAR
jgi:CubicO group peptidase (beta-lactamase class C family)